MTESTRSLQWRHSVLICSLKIQSCLHNCHCLLRRLPNSAPLPPHLSGDDVSGHDGLAVLVLGFTGVGSVVDGLHVLHGQDALRQSGGPTRASVHQPPGRADVNWPLVLCELINVGVSKSNNDYVCGCFVFHHHIFIFFSIFFNRCVVTH